MIMVAMAVPVSMEGLLGESSYNIVNSILDIAIVLMKPIELKHVSTEPSKHQQCLVKKRNQKTYSSFVTGQKV